MFSAAKGVIGMINYITTKNNYIEKITSPEEGCWISLVNPSEVELLEVSKNSEIDPDALRAALDADERSRIETDDTYTMILVNIPTVEEQDETDLYSTVPLAVFLTKNTVVTVCSENTPVLRQFAEGRVRDFRSNLKSRFILQILYRIDSLYLQYLRNIDKKSDEVEEKLHKSTKNSELIELLRLEKSLVYFTTALRSNESVLEKMLRDDNVKKYPEDAELLEDVIVENKQAIEMANIYSGILSGMMDAFASVISNNLNIVMKLLAVITIVMSIPTLIFSAYGMNLNLDGMPFSANPNGFLIICVMSAAISIGVAMIFRKMKMFK